MPQVLIKGEPLHYLDQGEGFPILLGHSYLWDHQMWAPQIAALSRQFRVIAPDLWGHGNSPRIPKQTRNLADIADDMLTLLDSLGIQEFALVGLSAGGMWGTELALKAPDRVKGLVLMDTFVGWEPEITHKKYFDILSAIEAAGQIPAQLLEQFPSLYFGATSQIEKPELVAEFTAHLAALSKEQLKAIVPMGRIIFGRRDQTDDLEKLTMPSLVMTGCEDVAHPVLEGRLMAECLNHAPFLEIPKAGHISNLEQSEFVNKQLLTFLTQHFGH